MIQSSSNEMEVESLTTDLESSKREIFSLQEKMSGLVKCFTKSKSEVAALKADLIVAQKRLKVKKRKEGDLKARVSESQKNMMVMAKSLNETCEELVVASKNLEELKNASESKIHGMQLVMQKLHEKLKHKENENNLKTSELRKRETEEVNLKCLILELKQEIQMLEEKSQERNEPSSPSFFADW